MFRCPALILLVVYRQAMVQLLVVTQVQVINPSEELILADGWEEYVPPTVSEEQQKEIEKSREARDAEFQLRESDYKIIKCMEYYLCGKELPYDIKALNEEREGHREKVRKHKEKKVIK